MPPSASSPPPSPTTAPPATASCRVNVAVNAWNNGLTETITITNAGATAADGWSLSFDLPADQTVTSGWSATYTPTTGHVVATNASYNAGVKETVARRHFPRCRPDGADDAGGRTKRSRRFR